MLIGVLYNPPIRSKRKFLDEFEQVLHSIFLSKQKCLILGDININTLVKRTIAKEYLNLVHSEGFNPFVFEATRITERTISCVDHIHSNFVSSSTSGSIVVEIADHLPVFSLSYDPLLSPFPDTIEIRDFKRFDETAFRDELRNEKWKSVCNSSDANESLARFLHTHIMVKPNDIMTKPHHVMVKPHHIMAKPHHVMVKPHHVMVKPHHIMVKPHHIMMKAHHIMVKPHHTMMKPHQVMVKPHHKMMKPHHIMVKPHHVITNDHIRKLWLSIRVALPSV